MDNDTNAGKARLKSYVERIERLTDNKDEIAEDIKEVYKEAKNDGFDTKIIKKVVTLRKMDAEDRMMQAELLKVYCDAVQLELF